MATSTSLSPHACRWADKAEQEAEAMIAAAAAQAALRKVSADEEAVSIMHKV